MTTALTLLQDELHAIIGALLAGARYGLKIRLPHAAVMTTLFQRHLSTRQRLGVMLRLALEHASNLAAFAAIYKSILLVFKGLSRHVRGSEQDTVWRSLGRTLMAMIVDGPAHSRPVLALAPPGHAQHVYHSFVAGAIGGYFVWGRYSSVNYQIVLYLASRVMVGLWHRMFPHWKDHPRLYPLAAAGVWGLVMALFEESPEVLHPSLRASMNEIYRWQWSNAGSERDAI